MLGYFKHLFQGTGCVISQNQDRMNSSEGTTRHRTGTGGGLYVSLVNTAHEDEPNSEGVASVGFVLGLKGESVICSGGRAVRESG